MNIGGGTLLIPQEFLQTIGFASLALVFRDCQPYTFFK
jgi:hypothetical protein